MPRRRAGATLLITICVCGYEVSMPRRRAGATIFPGDRVYGTSVSMPRRRAGATKPNEKESPSKWVSMPRRRAGATVDQSGEVIADIGFNGATSFQTWKLMVSSIDTPPFWEASMGPRLFRRGNESRTWN